MNNNYGDETIRTPVDTDAEDPSSNHGTETVQGKRIVEIDHFIKTLQDLEESHNSSLGCTFKDFRLRKEIRKGLQSELIFTCNKCKTDLRASTTSNSTDTLDINELAVQAIYSVGCGFTQGEEFFGSLDIPFMTFKTYQKQEKINKTKFWENTFTNELKLAAEEEAMIAKSKGHVDPLDGIPYTTVIVDGCWSKRSYKKNYNALSGAAVIIGAHTKKVLWVDVRNKYCVICTRSANKNQKPRKHDCTINFSGPSTKMESEILLDGFMKSESNCGLRFLKMIGDGDSSTYHKIVESDPYNGRYIEKFECVNHLMRNFRNKLDEVTKQVSAAIEFRKLLTKNCDRIRKDILSAVKHRKDTEREEVTACQLIKKDISNVIHHVFGDHSACPEYIKEYCNTNDINHIERMKRDPIYELIMTPTRRLLYNAKSLYIGQSTNSAENYNSVLAKMVGGKRINFSLGNGYKIRSMMAAVQYNTHSSFTAMHHNNCTTGPNVQIKQIEQRRKRSNRLALSRYSVKKALRIARKQPKKHCKTDKDYGQECAKPDLSKDDYEAEKQIVLKKLECNYIRRLEIERETVEQCNSPMWRSIRKTMLTASNFGPVIRARKKSSYVLLLLYPKFTGSTATRYGIDNEDTARYQLECEKKIKIRKCGIFIDSELNFLAASPDGLVNDDTIIEIKCPSSIENQNPTIYETLKKLKYIKFEKNTENIIGLKRNHKYFYQIQGQLHVTNRKKCIFAIWASKNHQLYVEEIERDDEFWKTEMETQLIDFFKDWLLPEIVDPRYLRGLPIKEPL